MSKNVFPKDFLWGAASAAAQVEGGFDVGGRTPSIWDNAPSKKIKNGEDCHTGCDHYHHMKEDVALMKEIGLKSYRFSISWSRILPSEDTVSDEGIAFYNSLIDELIAAGIEPVITVFHWDLPQWVQDKGGWMSEEIVKLFSDYARLVAESFSDRVMYFITINEPQCFIMNAYMQGIHAPFKKNYLALPRLTRNCLKAHGAAVRIIREKSRNAKVGIAMAFGVFVPWSDNPKDIEEARKLTFEKGTAVLSNKWWMDPILKGETVSAYGIYRLKKDDIKDVCVDLDFIGLNLYQPLNHQTWATGSKRSPVGAPKTSMGWDIDGRTVYWGIKFAYERYKLPIMVTENGMADYDMVSLDGKVHDPKRTDFMMRYLSQLKRAISENIPVIGYQYWSVMDNFEWAEGYDPRFGLIYVDYKTKKRILKDSAYEYREIIRTNGTEIPDDVY